MCIVKTVSPQTYFSQRPEPCEKKRRAYLSDEIKNAAKNNEASTIEELFTRACDVSDEGLKITQFLFSLYTKDDSENAVLARQLGKDSLKLVEIVSDRNKKKPPEDQWSIPTQILIMAGFEATDQSQLRSEIVAKIREQEPNFCSYIAEADVDASLFAANRLVTSAELDVIAKDLNATNSHVQCNDAVSIPDDANARDKIVGKLISLLGNGEVKQGQLPPSVNLIPLLYNGHWVLFGMLVGDDGKKSAVAFSSLACWDDEKKQHLTMLAHACGGADQAISFIEKNLQKHAPNACGLYVAQAMEVMANHSANKAADALRTYADDFAARDASEITLFNRNGRARLFDALRKHCHERNYPE